MPELYPIGDVSRRTGLPVSAIRFYSDAGIVAPSGHTGAGYRLYSVEAVARLELISTLRTLGTGLDEIRRLLASETTLHELATAHLAVVESELRRFQARRAVLRTIVRLGSGTAQVGLMHRLATMSDDDRAHLVDDFWSAAVADLDLPHPARPSLPPEPTSAQLEAWIELAGLIRDPDFRETVRGYFQETFAAPGAAEDRWTEAETARQVTILEEARAAHAAGLAVDSPQAREVATRFLAAIGGGLEPADARRQVADADPHAQVARHAALLGRYHSLVATINDTPPPDLTAPGTTWLHQAIRALT
jgi:DNA-binding transcriptional MerR regulator